MFDPDITGGRQILHGLNPISIASLIVISEETFFTILQLDKWYLAPDGVL